MDVVSGVLVIDHGRWCLLSRIAVWVCEAWNSGSLNCFLTDVIARPRLCTQDCRKYWSNDELDPKTTAQEDALRAKVRSEITA